MRFYFLFVLLLFMIPVSSISQEKDPMPIPQVKSEPYEGMKQFYKNFVDAFHVPEFKRDENQIKATLSFFVEKDGTFSAIKVKNVSDEVAFELIKTLEMMPKWKPAYLDGLPVRSSFILPIVIRLDPRDENAEENAFLKEVAQFRKMLMNYEQISSYFKFNCNCVTALITSDLEAATEWFQYETLDNVGTYNISVAKQSEKEKKLFFKTLLAEVSKSGVKFEKLKYGLFDAVQVSWIEKVETEEVYYRTLFFISDDKLFTLNFGSTHGFITELIFDELLNSFQIK